MRSAGTRGRHIRCQSGVTGVDMIEALRSPEDVLCEMLGMCSWQEQLQGEAGSPLRWPISR